MRLYQGTEKFQEEREKILDKWYDSEEMKAFIYEEDGLEYIDRDREGYLAAFEAFLERNSAKEWLKEYEELKAMHEEAAKDLEARGLI